jgi:hypothetical protein
MGIKITGFDELQKTLKDMGTIGDPIVFRQWAEKVESTARSLCNDPNNQRIKFKLTQNFGFEFDFADRESIDCVIRAIRQYLNSMPMTYKMLYERIITDLENRKTQFS